jgi:hypothetical protein
MAPFLNETARLSCCACVCTCVKSDRRCNAALIGPACALVHEVMDGGPPVGLSSEVQPNADSTDSNEAKTKGGRS